MTRSLIREQIFKLLFRIEFNSIEEMSQQVQLFFEDDLAEEDMPNVGADIPEGDAVYIRTKLDNIIEKLEDVDARISATSKGWTIGRIGKVEIAILRLAVYEMFYDDDIPVGVAIDEAVELTKKYGQDGSAAFVNGVLAAMTKDI